MDTFLAPRLTSADALAYLCSARGGVKLLKKALLVITAVLALTAAVVALTGRLDERRGNATSAEQVIEAVEVSPDGPVSAPRE